MPLSRYSRLPLIAAVLVILGLAPLQAIQYTAYVPDYRLSPTSGAENLLGRPSWDPGVHPWENRLAEDLRREIGLPQHWSEGSWSRRLSANFDRLYFHVPVNNVSRISFFISRIRILAGLPTKSSQDVVLSLAGLTSDFLPFVNDEEDRREFADMLALVCEQEDLAGIDLDWEFVGVPRTIDLDILAQFAEDLARRLPGEMTLSAAVSRWRLPGENFFSSLDQVNLMAYDSWGRHATFESAVADTEVVLARFLKEPDDLVLGIPWYGRNANSGSDEYWRETLNYREIVRRFDPVGDEAGDFFFNGSETIRRKLEWAERRGLAGIFVWEPFYDINGEKSLLLTLREHRRQSAKPVSPE